MNTITINNTSLDSHLSGTIGRFGAGLTAKLSQLAYLYTEYDSSAGNHVRKPWHVNIGMRFQW